MRRATRISGASVTQRALEAQPRRTPAQTRSRDTVATILKAAARVFATLGYTAATTNRIADRAGVSIGSLYEYFPNKDAILFSLMEAHLEEGQAVLRQAGLELATAPRDLEGTVRRYVSAMVQLHAADPRLHRVLFEEAPRSRRIRQKILALEKESTAWTEQYLRSQSGISFRDPGLVAAILVQAVEAMTHKVVIHAEPSTNVDAYVEEIVALAMGYLTARR
jgi:AcrR family transcriptional regulator